MIMENTIAPRPARGRGTQTVLVEHRLFDHDGDLGIRAVAAAVMS
jgi:hypothetical protein